MKAVDLLAEHALRWHWRTGMSVLNNQPSFSASPVLVRGIVKYAPLTSLNLSFSYLHLCADKAQKAKYHNERNASNVK